MARAFVAALARNAALVAALARNAALVTAGSSSSVLGLSLTSTSGSAMDLMDALGQEARAIRLAAQSRWEGSRNEEIYLASVQTKGTLVGETIAAFLFNQAGLTVESAFQVKDGIESPAASYDLNVAKLNRVDNKLSTDGAEGVYKWSSMRPTAADYFLLEGVTPENIQGWLIPAGELNRLFGLKATGSKVVGLTLNAKSGAYALSFPSDKVPAWLAPYGGTESALMDRITTESRRRSRR